MLRCDALEELRIPTRRDEMADRARAPIFIDPARLPTVTLELVLRELTRSTVVGERIEQLRTPPGGILESEEVSARRSSPSTHSR